jgi:hypothetical protein
MQKEYWIHPAIGIARVGNSDEHFLGPEKPGDVPDAGGSYKDEQGQIKRQAQRFRIYEYEVDGSNATPIREITADDATITWQVHMVNRKGALDEETAFQLRTSPAGPRNVGEAKERVTIDPGKTEIKAGDSPKTLVDTFLDDSVELGRISVEDSGRLVIVGGQGKSESVPPGDTSLDQRRDGWINNDGWYDGTSDGVVSAAIEFDDRPPVSTDQDARIIGAPPSYAPAIENVVTLYDAVLNAAWQQHPSVAPQVVEPNFEADILPILRRVVMLQWTSGNARRGHRSGLGNFLDSDQLANLLANNDRDRNSEAYNRRRRIFVRLVVPRSSNPPESPLSGRKDMPRLADAPGLETSLTPHQYEMMRQWSLGVFEVGSPVDNRTPVQREVDDLDRAAIESATGAPWFPGIESWSILSRPETFERPFRVKSSVEPGYLTIANALPWQADFRACSIEGGEGWWPSQRPNVVTREVNGQFEELKKWVPDDWLLRDMVDRWMALGFIVEKDDRFVENWRNV